MKKLIRYIFELRFLPKVSAFLFDNETWLRMRPIKRFFNEIDPQKKLNIIDVGGGTGRLELRLNRTDVTIYDLDERSIEIASQSFKNAVVGTGSRISYDDNSFDYAISIHTLEHIPKDQREFFILEMIRISKKGVFLNFPEGIFAEKLCHNFLSALEKNGLEKNKWTIEHLEMGIPLFSEIEAILSKQSKFQFEYKFTRNYWAENLYWTILRSNNNFLINYILTPWLSIFKFFLRSRKPTVEIILIGTRLIQESKRIVNKL